MTEARLHELLTSIGIGPIIRRNRNLTACCPNHSETRPSWGIQIEDPHVHGCFSCGYKGNIVSLLVDRGGMSYEQAYALADMERPIHIAQFSPEQEAPPDIDESELYPFEIEGPGLRYMTEQRGVRKATLRTCGVVYDPNANRVMFPWYLGDKLLAVTGRAVDPNIEDKYKIVAYFDTRKGVTLYLPQRRITSEPFVLVEGEIDALKVYQTGWRNVGATGQGKITKAQRAQLLGASFQTLIVFTDDDRVGDLLADTASATLGHAKQVYRVDYSKVRGPNRGRKIDPAGLRPGDVLRLLSTAGPKIFTDWQALKH